MKTYRLYFSLLLACLYFHPLPAQQKGWIPAGNLQVYFEKTGKGEPILFLHAGYMDHTMWQKQVAFFSGTHTVITIDQPKHGLTKGSDSTTLVADIIRICLDSLHIKKTSLVGLSIGGVSMTDFALAYPERVNKLVFVCAGVNGFQDVIEIDSLTKSVFAHAQAAGQTGKAAEIAKTFTESWCDGPFRKPGVVNSSVRNYVYSQVVNTVGKHQDEHFANFKNEPAAAAQVNRIAVPALIICADKDVPYINTLGKYLHQQIKGSKFILFHGSAHMVNMEQPTAFNAALAKFL